MSEWGKRGSGARGLKRLGVGVPHKHTPATAWGEGQAERRDACRAEAAPGRRPAEGSGNGEHGRALERVGEAAGRADEGAGNVQAPSGCCVRLGAVVASQLCPRSLLA